MNKSIKQKNKNKHKQQLNNYKNFNYKLQHFQHRLSN